MPKFIKKEENTETVPTIELVELEVSSDFVPADFVAPPKPVWGDTPLDSFEVVWYKAKYQTSLLRHGNTFVVQNVDTGSVNAPAALQGLLRELGLEEDLEALETQLWIRGLALTEQLDKLSQLRLAELVEDVRKRNK